MQSDQTFAGSNIFRASKRPPEINELRARSWSFLLPPESETDPVWVERCKRYWELQERLYGLRFSDFVMFVDYGNEIVTTCAYVMDIMPGQREPNYTPVWLEDIRAAKGLHS